MSPCLDTKLDNFVPATNLVPGACDNLGQRSGNAGSGNQIPPRQRVTKAHASGVTFVFHANGKNSTSTVCPLAFVRGNEHVCVCRESVFFSLFF